MRTLFRVILPLARPGLVAVGFYAFMISWNEFLFALTLTQTDNMRTVPVGLDAADGPVQLSMEPDNGHERPWLPSCRRLVPDLPAALCQWS